MAKLTDLGLALDTAEGEGELTREGLTVGTFDYISPEQARHSRSVDTRTDIYSLGCSLYHMIAGRVPFPMPSLPEKLYAHQVAEPEPLTRLVPGVPEGLDAVVRRMMHKTTDGRYPTPLAVAMALEPFQGIAAASPAVATPTPAPPGSPSSADGAEGGPGSASYGGSDPELIHAQPGPPGAFAVWPRLPEGSGPAPAAPRPVGPGRSPRPPAPARAEEESDVIEVEDESEPGHVPVARPAAAQARVVEFGARPGSDSGSDAFTLAPAGQSSGELFRPAQASSTDMASDFDSILPDSSTLIEPLREPPARGRAGRRAVNAVAVVLVAAVSLYVLYRGVGRILALMPDQKSSVPDDGRGKGLQLPKGIMVRLPDGSKPGAADLKEALALVAPAGGEVVIDGPVFLKVEAPAELGGGKVAIRSTGPASALMLELAGPGPWLRSKAGGSLTLENLTVAVTLQGQASSALIEAEGDLDARRCLFLAAGRGEDSRALVARGPRATIEGCGFRGFDRPVDLELDPGATASFEQCQLVWSKADPRKSGWAVRVRPGGGPGKRELSFEHCTIAGGGPVEVLGDFSAESPLAVTLRNTAVLADAMILWGPPPKAFPKAIPWEGKGNRYNIQKVAWVVLPPTGLSGLPDGPTDPSAWEKVLPEAGLVPRSFRFAVGDTAETLLRPEDYALTDKDAAGVGADPKRVGPAGGGK